MARPKRRFRHLVQFQPTDAGGFQMPGADGRVLGFVEAWHRKRVSYSPYCIPNELICGTIGRFLGLPIPPFGITYFGKEPYFSSLNFNPTTDQLPPIEPHICAITFPRICTGILFFDVLVANADRHDENLAVDNIDSPKQIVVYDHDQALFGNDGVARLDKLRDRLGVTGGTVTGGNENCLLKAISTTQYFSEWRERIYDIPDWFIKDACDDAIGVGINTSEARAAAGFLKHRKRNLIKILKSPHNGVTTFDEWEPKHALFD